MTEINALEAAVERRAHAHSMILYGAAMHAAVQAFPMLDRDGRRLEGWQYCDPEARVEAVRRAKRAGVSGSDHGGGFGVFVARRSAGGAAGLPIC